MMWTRLFKGLTIDRWVYFFPVQLFLVHLQRNFILILFWLILLAYITGIWGAEYGLQFLFVYPEYLGDVNVWAYIINGIAFGGFIMAFNISSYIINSRRFPFLATLNRPFMKYCLNNSLIPIVVTLVYVIEIFRILYFGEYTKSWVILLYILSFLGGTVFFVSLTLFYFYTLNHDISRVIAGHPPKVHDKPAKAAGVQVNHQRNNIRKLRRRFKLIEEVRVDTYMQNFFKIALTRSTSHYGTTMIMRVFQQNHVNAAIFEVVIFGALITLGIFREISVFKIPASASILLLFTMLLMLASAVHFILKRWSTVFFVAGFIVLNYLSTFRGFSVKNYAYGLNYEHSVAYDPDAYLDSLIAENPFEKDIAWHEEILENWKTKNQREDGEKPWLVVVSCSGGGLKSAVWTFGVLQHLDSISGGKLLDQVYLITGSSGGMIGAAYLRELYYMKEKGVLENYYNDSFTEQIGKDILNPVAATLALNDLFIRLQTFSEGTYRYPKDRGYAFEKQLNENTGYLLDHRLADYTMPEKNAEIPLMLFSPTIINDGKRIVISSQPLSFISNNLPVNNEMYRTTVEDFEFCRLFKDQNAMNLKFTSAIRMNATFPYILPTVSLPTLPTMQVVDAGVRDNYGIRTAVKYLFHLREWINENTSGVIVLKVHDSRPVDYNIKYVRSMSENLFSPLGGIFNNLSRVHMQENDQMLQFASEWFGGKFRVIDFRLTESLKDKEISMSLHLTAREKENIKKTLRTKRIQTSVDELMELIQ